MVTTVTNNSPLAINTSLFSLEKEIRESTEALEKEINEKVKLSASDVGAIPLPAIPETDGTYTDGTYTLQCTVSDGEVTYSWVSVTTE